MILAYLLGLDSARRTQKQQQSIAIQMKLSILSPRCTKRNNITEAQVLLQMNVTIALFLLQNSFLCHIILPSFNRLTILSVLHIGPFFLYAAWQSFAVCWACLSFCLMTLPHLSPTSPSIHLFSLSFLEVFLPTKTLFIMQDYKLCDITSSCFLLIISGSWNFQNIY